MSHFRCLALILTYDFLYLYHGKCGRETGDVTPGHNSPLWCVQRYAFALLCILYSLWIDLHLVFPTNMLLLLHPNFLITKQPRSAYIYNILYVIHLCSFSSSSLNYSPARHTITGDVDIVQKVLNWAIMRYVYVRCRLLLYHGRDLNRSFAVRGN